MTQAFRCLLSAVLIVSSATSIHAQSQPAATAPPPRPTSVLGAAWAQNNTPIAQARVRLRNVATGAIAALSVTSSGGQFTFTAVAPGSYVVELLSNDAASVLSVGHVFTINEGETIATFVKASGNPSFFTSIGHHRRIWLGVAAVAAAAVIAGVAGR